MFHLPTLITDLALILISAGIVSILFKWLKQPVVLGYIIAGFLASPQITFLPTVADERNIQTWADIGVIFLLFALGLDFSFKKLMRVGVTAFIGTFTIVIAMMTLGYITGMSLGWSHMNSLFLGGMLCMSSTMIIIKLFDDFGLKNQKFANIVLGILVVEDLFAVLLMVLLSTLAISKTFEGTEMLDSIFKLVEFLLFWFLIGIFLIPTLLKRAKKHLNDETLLVVSLGLCLTMVILATEAGFSSALGAFVMGSILAETLEAEHIEHLVQPVKNLFGAIFFVSVGMMINLSVLQQYIWPIVIISLVVIVGQVTFATIGILLSGQPLKVAIQAGFSLSQIGEFSYIIAALGLSLGVIAPHLYPVIVAVSVVTIFISPYIIKCSEPVYKFIEEKSPQSWYKFMNKEASVARPVNNENTWKKLIKDIVTMVAIYLAFILMIIFFLFQYLVPFVAEHIEGIRGKILSASIIILIISPFLRAIMAKKNRSKEFEELWGKNKANRGPLIFLIAIRIILCMIILFGILLELFHVEWLIMLPIVTLLVILFFYSKRLKKNSILIERRFKRNFHARQVYQEQHAIVKTKFVNHLLDKDLHLSDFEVKQDYSIIGKTLKELNFRQLCGVNVVKIIRGNKRINIPGGDERLYPFDHIVVLGNDTQMKVFQQFIEEKGKMYHEISSANVNATPEVIIAQFQIEPQSKFIGKTIKTSHIRDKFDCLVVGIERGESSTMNPDINLEFMANDVIWVVGEHDKIVKLNELWNETPTD
ncbi:MAG: cation:proton antiporter [Candidatus Azobacteroides sp.]|nr:cation:proton antiporter [Candidatus Azobacteroides sp.]